MILFAVYIIILL